MTANDLQDLRRRADLIVDLARELRQDLKDDKDAKRYAGEAEEVLDEARALADLLSQQFVDAVNREARQ